VPSKIDGAPRHKYPEPCAAVPQCQMIWRSEDHFGSYGRTSAACERAIYDAAQMAAWVQTRFLCTGATVKRCGWRATGCCETVSRRADKVCPESIPQPRLVRDRNHLLSDMKYFARRPDHVSGECASVRLLLIQTTRSVGTIARRRWMIRFGRTNSLIPHEEE
jgi:hypothetical protein